MKYTVHAGKNNRKGILTLLEESGVSLPCNCGGKHLCSGKNYSFDCSMVPKEPVTVCLPDSSAQIQGIALEDRPLSPGTGDTLLIDLGTTTVALVLMNRMTGTLQKCSVFANPQLAFGADIISRIQASSNGKSKELSRLIKEDLRKHCRILCQKNGQTQESITSCFIGGNTAMIHLLLGYDCSPLARAPFQPVTPSPSPFFDGDVYISILPWISSFVGGDITAGIFACGLYPKLPDHTLFVDLGTNGEMVLSNDGHLFTASTAAGPALEGHGLSCGCPAVPGAISHVQIIRKRVCSSTIENRIPCGICGSGAISLCAELLRVGLIHDDGTLSDDFPKEGILLGTDIHGQSLRFTAGDLRQIQPAIAAIGTGIDTLCHEAGISPEKLECLFIGGGFGMFLSVSDCIRLRLLPPVSVDRIHMKGNTCLQGLYEMTQRPFSPASLHDCIIQTELTENAYFKKRFINHLTYGKDEISTTNS